MQKGMLDLARFKGEWKGVLLLLSELIPSIDLRLGINCSMQVHSLVKVKVF